MGGECDFRGQFMERRAPARRTSIVNILVLVRIMDVNVLVRVMGINVFVRIMDVNNLPVRVGV